ncbi:MAG TPA: autotransporter-associated beta strand repeat-containing protein, partial [Verrucomicrobiota bacterium]|nr:autotransporter-associated beta strand repeat-containing protein [Verrucomicrobiota bacterium]
MKTTSLVFGRAFARSGDALFQCVRTMTAAALMAILWAGPEAGAAVLSWSGGGTTAYWSDIGNWGYAGTPNSGDTLVFPAGQPRATNTNDLSSRVFNQIRFAGAGGGYAIYGQAFTVTNSIQATNIVGANAIYNDISLYMMEVTVNVASGASLNLAGALSGTIVGSLIKTGAGTLRLSGAGSNNYGGGTLVDAGTLELYKVSAPPATAIPGNLYVGDGVNSATVLLLAGTEIADYAEVVVHQFGVFNLNGWSDVIGSLTLIGGKVQTGGGLLTVNGNLETLPSLDTAFISGRLRFTGGLRTVSVRDGTAFYDLELSASISDDGGGLLFTNTAATGGSWIRLLGSNSFTGPLFISQTTVDAENPWSLGTTAGGTTVGTGGRLWLYATGITNETLVLKTGASLTAQYDCVWAGPISLDGDAVIRTYPDPSVFEIIGTVSGARGFTKTDTGVLRLSGASQNTYAGDTILNTGRLELNKANAIRYGRLVIGDGWGGNDADVVRELVNEGIYGGLGGATVVIRSSGLLDLNGHSDYLGPIEFDGGSLATGASGLLNLAPPVTSYRTDSTNGNGVITGRMLMDASSVFVVSNNLELQATISGAGSLIKDGYGYLFLLGSNSFSGLTVIQDGMLWVYSPWSLGTTAQGTIVSNGASLVLFGSFGITNEVLTLNGPGENSGYGALDSETAGTNLWVGPITLNAPDCTIAPFRTNTVLRILGSLNGSGGFTQFGQGTVYLEGVSANGYTGPTWVQSGRLLLAQTVTPTIPGSGLTIGDGLGDPATAVVRELASFQIGSIPLTLNNDGLLDLNGFNDTLGLEINFNGGDIQTASGTLSLLNGNTLRVNADGSSIYGNLNVGASTSTWTGADFKTLSCYAVIHGSATLNKTGGSYLSLYNSNNFSGPLIIQDGLVFAGHDRALGQTNNGTTVVAPGRLGLVNGITVRDEALAVSGPLTLSQLFGSANSNTFTGPISFTNEVRIGVSAGGTLNLAGPISGPGGFAKIEAGTLLLSGALANTYGGETRVLAGTLELNKVPFDGAIPGNLSIGDGIGGADADVVRLLEYNQIANTATVTIQSSGLLDLGTFFEGICGLNGSGHLELGTQFLHAGYNNCPGDFAGVISGSGYFAKQAGTNTYVLSGTNTHTGATRVSAGTLLINGYQPQSPVIADASGTLGGSGVIGTLTASARVAPGASPGALTCSNAYFSSAGTLVIDLDNNVPGAGYDQLRARGAVGLTNTTLQVLAAFSPGYDVRVGDQFVIIDNDGSDPVIGGFSGFPNHSEFTAGGDYRLRIDYDGGSGNDVVLTVVGVPASAVSGSLFAGNGNHLLDPNECNHLVLVISNTSATAMTGLSARLWTTNEEVFITQPWSAYPDIPPGGKATNNTLFQVSSLPRLACGSELTFMLSVHSASHGAFTTPLAVLTGSGLAPSLAFTNSTPAAIPDGDAITSSIPVTGFDGYLGKATVSLFVTHARDDDLGMFLIAPDGTVVELTSDNGGTGQNYGSACVPFENRTVFDDSAVTPITGGTAPFIGLYRPESPLSALRGRTSAAVNGTWRLVIADDTSNGQTGALVCWYLNLYPADCVEGGGMCETCPGTFQGTLDVTDPSMIGRFQLFVEPSACGQSNACPMTQLSSVRYETWVFTNDGPAACVTVMVDTYDQPIQASAYLGAFNPNNLCQNYLGYAGTYAPPAQRFAFNVPAYTNFLIVVNDLGTGCTNYTLFVSGTPCPPPELAIEPAASPHQIRLHWPTWAAG